MLGGPWRSVLVGGGLILLCIVLLSLLFFLSLAWRVRHPRGHPVEGLGVNKADGRGLWRSLHSLASPLSSVSHLCGQVSRGTVGRARHPEFPRCPLAPICAQPPSAWVVTFYLRGETLFPQAHGPVWVALSGVISPPPTPGVFPCADKAMQNPLGEKGEGPPPSAVPARWLLL